jgi:phage repressor protein C with HTH and peptisase S24 domain
MARGATLSTLEGAGNNSYDPLGWYGEAMLTHAQVWSAIDRLAARAGLSASGLARRAGLDPTTFNKSKRITAAGRARWPSTESIAKALAATGTSMEVFVALVQSPDGGAAARGMPLLGFAEAGAGSYFDDGGFPAGTGWDEIAFPAVNDDHAYALKISGQSMEPAYRHGDVIIVSPAAPIRRGDRVVVKTTAGEVMAKELKRHSAKAIELKSLNAQDPDRTLSPADVLWMARIVWSSQ